MSEMNDNELLGELTRRFQDNKKALHDMKVMNEKIEKLNVKLAESERLKTNFLSNIRNEINNPLTSILGLARQLAAPGKDEKTREMIAGMIYNEAFELDYQLRNIFIAAELEAGETSVNSGQVDVSTLLRHVAASFHHKTREKKLEVSISTGGREKEQSALLFRTDAEKIRLIAANLLGNAIEFSDPGKKIEVEIRRDKDQLLLSIADQGIGIREEDIPRLFERFRQLDQGTAKKHKGHGLGLSVTKAVVDMLGGKISVARRPVGGSIFQITVPESAERGGDTFSGDGNEFIFESGNRF